MISKMNGKVKFFLPNFEDMVDPDFDFINDRNSPQHKDRWAHDRFAHEFFPEPIFDGMLVSKASLKPSVEERIDKAGGIHAFTRLNRSLKTMADCGAFTFILEEKPVYTLQQVLDNYQRLRFDYGVSLDHLAFITVEMLEAAFAQGRLKQRWWDGKTTKQIQEERFELTLQNAREFLDLCTQQRVSFTPVGIAQGGTPDLYYIAVDRLISMGYEYIALGGMIRSSDEEIISVLEKIQPLVKNGIKLHIFGVARLALIPHFIRLGVTSADTAGPLRRAFLGSGEDNYWLSDGRKYAAIRIPEAKPSRAKRGVFSPEEVFANGNHTVKDFETLIQKEQLALTLLRKYDRGEANFQETLEAVLNYDRLFGNDRNHEAWYARTLRDQPWKECSCPICKSIGIDVIIFRGNNRNRRRGFHNVKVFFEQFQNAIKQNVSLDSFDMV